MSKVRPWTKPSLKDLVLQKYLNPFRILPDDLVELKKEFDPVQVDALTEALQEKDYLNESDIQKCVRLGLDFGKLKPKKWQYPWAHWASNCVNSRWFEKELIPEAQTRIFTELGNLDEQGISVSSLVSFIYSHLESEELCGEAIFTLGKIGMNAREAVPCLSTVLGKSCSSLITLNAVWALGQMGIAAILAVPDLIKRLGQLPYPSLLRGRSLRQELINTLSGIAPSIIPQLVEAMNHQVCQGAIRQIFSRSWGEELKKSAVRYLADGRRSMKNRAFAVFIIQENEEKDIESVLIDSLTSNKLGLTDEVQTIKALGTLGSRARVSLVKLAHIVMGKDKLPEIREAALESLHQMGADGKAVIHYLWHKIQSPPLKERALEMLEGEANTLALLHQTVHLARQRNFIHKIDGKPQEGAPFSLLNPQTVPA